MKPLHLFRSIVYFAIPTLLMFFIFRKVMPMLDLLAFRLFHTFLIGFGVPSLLLFLCAVWFYRREGNPWTIAAFRERFRLQKMDGQGWMWTVGLSVAWIAGLVLLQPVSEWMQQNAVMPPKLWYRMMLTGPNYFMEVPVNSFQVPLGIGLFVLINVLGEELFWRGYIFPRQELSFGSKTWVVHGILWAIFRSFLFWDIAFILFASLSVSFVVQRTRCTWPALFAHCLVFAGIPAI